ncbi:MAG: hypothetical protein A3C35_00360 [Omnitrophica bacterium RIFCSPHIGHO2_02_FULL_46_11]|nr:MAG: hypothetical protein A3A81_08170 [Omnitrophica bacterium RIFCSPLOWO2_01_FULL_45_10b]OGW87154.1 MAG: hypothetical protein A3C35_00360 [Omnitrophica bacterium RIFCSPHIGHO2_02_FULL_46_11]
MQIRNRRKQFLIDKTLQFHYFFYIVAALSIVSAVGITGSYFGIWASVVKAFSEESLRQTITTAAQISEYEQARQLSQHAEYFSQPGIREYKETSLLSERQKEIVREIMDETNRTTIGLGIFLVLFIGWGSIFLTHKVAGPIFKMGQYIRELQKGDLTVRIKFRKFDEIHHLAGEFNEMVSALEERVSKIKRLVRTSPNQSIPKELKEELEKFKTTSD